MYRYFIIILILTIVIISIYLLTRNKDDNPTIEEVYLGVLNQLKSNKQFSI